MGGMAAWRYAAVILALALTHSLPEGKFSRHARINRGAPEGVASALRQAEPEVVAEFRQVLFSDGCSFLFLLILWSRSSRKEAAPRGLVVKRAFCPQLPCSEFPCGPTKRPRCYAPIPTRITRRSRSSPSCGGAPTTSSCATTSNTRASRRVARGIT